MRRRGWWIVRASLGRSGGRSPWALASLALVGALVASLLGVRARLAERAGEELARFGPNVIVAPADAAAADFPSAWVPDVATLRRLGVDVAIGVRRDAEGRAAVSVIDARSGAPAWAQPGSDARLLADADVIVADAATPASFETLALRVRPDALDELVDTFGHEAPGLSARVVRGVAYAESRVLHRTSAFMLGVSVVLLALSGLCLSSTLTAQWLERRGEIGLLIALGGTRSRVAKLFAGEVASLALAGGLAGGIAGSVLGWWVLRRGFAWEGSLASWPWWTLAAAVVASLVVAAGGSAVPLWRAVRAEPVAALRGE